MSNDNMTAEQVLDVLAENMRDKDAGVIRLGIRDNDKTREAIAWLLENRAALSAPRVGRAALSMPDAFDMPEFSTINRSSLNYKAGWNACRRAMLAASHEPVAPESEWADRPDNLRRMSNFEQNARQVIDDLRAEVEALKADHDRIDAIDALVRSSKDVEIKSDVPGVCITAFNYYGRVSAEFRERTLRETLDAARLRQGGQNG